MIEIIQRHYDALSDEHKYLFDERAAMHEHDANMPRYVAERMAHRHICAIKRKEKENA
jgi:hypothetical protein